MRPLVIVSVCLIGLSGCTQQSDPYGDAMKRLVAEQKQLDWIEGKLKEVRAKVEAATKEANASMKDYPKEVAIQDPAAHTQYAMNVIEMHKISVDQISEESKPWIKKKHEQMKRVEAARKAVDELTPK